MSKLSQLKRLVKNKTGEASNAKTIVGALKELVKDVTSEDSNALTIEGALKELADYYEPEPEKVATPAATPAAGEVESGTEVELTCATAGADIYYTTNGDTPTTSSTKYTAKIAISAETTIKAIGVKSGMTNSDVLSAAYTIAEDPENGEGDNV